ncbi:HD domain-containing phosphohydrolase [Piscinibacter sakaiensis]|uniref:GAF domain/HD domain protein n=1 Tax=Piscinibacter sakaiensis TaxID=1547922 RepID=A0A0K8NYY1_PISS1|nr:HD domain-containing phosphohydrolase [Piscinibacter sakaiensis]GAP35607.1 GAF domain/HD domain protein [Piscinibacter sakaiensis]
MPAAIDDLVRETAALLSALHERDRDTRAHSGRTSALAVEVGQACGLDADGLYALGVAADLHDVGKIGIPDRILLKPGRLDEEETVLMRSHARRGHRILSAIPGDHVAAIADIVLHHHEAADGSGYPDGLSGDAIPLPARIVAVVDAYDAMATVRPYHRPRRHADILHVLRDEQPQRYDPAVLDTFLAVIERSRYRAAD